MQAPGPSSIAPLALAPLLVWRVHSRIRRMVERQRLSKLRPLITLIVFPALVILLAFTARTHLELLGSLAAGLAAGSLLGVYGIRAGYYIVYAIGLANWRNRVLRAKRLRESGQGTG